MPNYGYRKYFNDCDVCGGEFESVRYGASTCSAKCRKRKQRLDEKYRRQIERMHDILDWLRSNRPPLDGREQWERDLMSISRRANDITLR